jgi:hypothetical protein
MLGLVIYCVALLPIVLAGYAHWEFPQHVNDERYGMAIFHLCVIAAGYVYMGFIWPFLVGSLPLPSLGGGGLTRPQFGIIMAVLLAWFIIPCLRDLLHYLLNGRSREAVLIAIGVLLSGACLVWFFAPWIA